MDEVIASFFTTIGRYLFEHPEQRNQIHLAIENGVQDIENGVQETEEDNITIENPTPGDVFELNFTPRAEGFNNFRHVQVFGLEENPLFPRGTIRVKTFDISNPLNTAESKWTAEGLRLTPANTKYVGKWPILNTEISERNPNTGEVRLLEPEQQMEFPVDPDSPWGYGGRRTTKSHRRNRKGSKKRGKSRKSKF